MINLYHHFNLLHCIIILIAQAVFAISLDIIANYIVRLFYYLSYRLSLIFHLLFFLKKYHTANTNFNILLMCSWTMSLSFFPFFFFKTELFPFFLIYNYLPTHYRGMSRKCLTTAGGCFLISLIPLLQSMVTNYEWLILTRPSFTSIIPLS